MVTRPPFTSTLTTRLAAEVQRWGICHLTAGDDLEAQASAAAAPLAPATLLASLALEPDPRVHAACVPLLLRHPELATDLPEALVQAQALAPDGGEELVVLSLAAAYLQQTMRKQLTWVLGPQPTLSLPPAFWEARHLPPPAPDSSEEGLEALNHYEQARQQVALNFQGDWRSAANHLFKQEWLERKWRLQAKRAAAPPTAEEQFLGRLRQTAEAWAQTQDARTRAFALEVRPISPGMWAVLVSLEPRRWGHDGFQPFDECWVIVRTDDSGELEVSGDQPTDLALQAASGERPAHSSSENAPGQ